MYIYLLSSCTILPTISWLMVYGGGLNATWFQFYITGGTLNPVMMTNGRWPVPSDNTLQLLVAVTFL